MMKKILIGLVLLTTSCFSKGEGVCVKSDNKNANDDFKLTLLFEKDGCKMYRFKDGITSIYWSDCSGRIKSEYQEFNASTKTYQTKSTTTIND